MDTTNITTAFFAVLLVALSLLLVDAYRGHVAFENFMDQCVTTKKARQCVAQWNLAHPAHASATYDYQAK